MIISATTLGRSGTPGIVPRRWPRGHFWDRGANFGLEGFATALMGGQRLMARLVPWFALRVMGAL